MPSPFPGMNPYLEQDDVWQDFRLSFIPLIRQVLHAQVRPGYVVKVEEKLFIHELSADERRLFGRGDVTLAESGIATAVRPSAGVLEAPFYGHVPLAVDVERQAFLEIRDGRNRELITVIELLSPSNKRPGPDREQYLAKRLQILMSNVHFVEIDLLRGGPRLPVEDLPECDYYSMVSRASERPRVSLWPFRLRQQIPPIPIPLRAPDPDVLLELQPALHRLYDEAGYGDYIYLSTPQPPLSPEDDAWTRELLPAGARVHPQRT